MIYQDDTISDDDDDYFVSTTEINPIDLLLVPNIEHLERSYIQMERMGVVDDNASGG